MRPFDRVLRAAAAIVACTLLGAADAADRTLARPIEVRGKLVSGATFSGQLRRWSDDGIEGSFGRHAWLDLVGPDVRRRRTTARSMIWAMAQSRSDFDGPLVVPVLIRAARRVWKKPTASRISRA